MPPTAAPQQQSVSLLLALPEPLLLAVLQCLSAASDHRSLFSAARAHSRLHQAAVAVLSSITVQGIRRQQVLDVVVSYLSKHGQHVSSVSLEGAAEPLLTLRQLPSTLQLHSLELHCLQMQLLPGAGCQGVLASDGLSSLIQLRLNSCTLSEDQAGLAAALAQLPSGLEHVSVQHVSFSGGINEDDPAAFPMSVLQQRLQQLTHLELEAVLLHAADRASPVLQPLQALSRLVDLRLAPWQGDGAQPEGFVSSSMLSGASGLTRLELAHVGFEPGVLAGKTQLQHLKLYTCNEVMGAAAAWAQQLLQQLQPLLQLTYLGFPACDLSGCTPASCSALTASSKLQHLGLNRCTLPAGVWQHVFPAGRQLPHLTSLQAWSVRQGTGGCMAAPEGSRLVSCCPALRSLDVSDLRYSPGSLASLQGLRALHTLLVGVVVYPSEPALGEVFQLTRLRDLDLNGPMMDQELLLLQTTQLKQLTRLSYRGTYDGGLNLQSLVWVAQAPGDEAVWRQVLRLHLGHSDPAVAQQAAAALAAD